MTDQSPELQELAAALGGVPAPCQTGDPQAWFEASEQAAELCRGCHAATQCLTLAQSLRVTDGVWGGHDFTRRTRTGARRATHHQRGPHR